MNDTTYSMLRDLAYLNEKEAEPIHAILDVLHQRKLTVAEAHAILHKADQAIELIPFAWNEKYATKRHPK